MGYQTDKEIVAQISAEINSEILKSAVNLKQKNAYEVLFVDEWLKTHQGKYQVYYPITVKWEPISGFNVGYFQHLDAEKELTKLLTQEIKKTISKENDRDSKNR